MVDDTTKAAGHELIELDSDVDNSQLRAVTESATLALLLAEYSTARDEISKRSDAQLGIQNIALSSIIALVGIVIVYEADPFLLIVGSIACSIFSMIWIDHANVISSLGSHIRTTLAPIATELAGDNRLMTWEAKRRIGRPRLFRFKTFGPQILIFEGLNVALLAASYSAVDISWDGTHIVKLGLWLAGVALCMATWLSWVQLVREEART